MLMMMILLVLITYPKKMKKLEKLDCEKLTRNGKPQMCNRGFKLWPKTDYLKLLPPRVRRMPGRPSISRRKDASESGHQSKSNKYGNEEVTKVGRQMTCKNCWEVGHNSRGCKNQKSDAPIKQRNPIGRPKGRMPQVPESISESGSRGRGSTVRGSISGRGSMDRKRPQLGVGEAMVGVSIKVWVDIIFE